MSLTRRTGITTLAALVLAAAVLVPALAEPAGGFRPGQPNDGLCDDPQFTAFRQRAGA